MMDADQARDFLIPRIAAQAERQRRPLSTSELQTLMFPDVEHHDTSPTYEARFATLIARTYENLPSHEEAQWHEAVAVLEAEGTYLSLLLISSREVLDTRRLRRNVFYTALVIAALAYASRWI